MKKTVVIISLLAFIIAALSFSKKSLRDIYSLPASEWPKPTIDEGVQWTELGILPESPLVKNNDSLNKVIELGKALFFDTRLSGSGKISCASCHQPELNWTDGKERSTGHEGAITKRNSPSIQNTWFYKRLFWDGRSKDLQDQAFAPINSETEMHSEMHQVMQKLSRVKGYKQLFKEAFGSEDIDPFMLTDAIATFEKTIISAESRFDKFLKGDKRALSNSELRGLHLFRTKARCMNCHNGPLFSDNLFHNNGFQQNGDPQNDKGYYLVSHKEEDIGKFKTPSLRDVMKTGPWMHNGLMKTMEDVLMHYNKGAKGNGGADAHVTTLFLTNKEQAELLAFLKAISTQPIEFKKPVLPE
jgi:cytochrome c peroxidase